MDENIHPFCAARGSPGYQFGTSEWTVMLKMSADAVWKVFFFGFFLANGGGFLGMLSGFVSTQRCVHQTLLLTPAFREGEDKQHFQIRRRC